MVALALNPILPAAGIAPPPALVRQVCASPIVPKLTLYREPRNLRGEVCMTIRQLLKNKGSYVPSIRTDASVREVLDKLDVDNAGALVVTDDSENIVGLISERDIVRGLQKDGIATVDAPVRRLMSNVVYTCDVNDPLSNVLELMDTHQFRHVPIRDGHRLCGIINMLDVVKFRLQEIQCEAEALKAYVAGEG
jgi:CBS domain-containing protein